MINNKLSVPVCRQVLNGWPNSAKKDAQKGSTKLKSLNLPDDVVLELNDLTDEGNWASGAKEKFKRIFLFLGTVDDIFTTSPQKPETFQLRINYINECRTLTLNFPASKTVLDIKNDLYALLKIPVRFQKWIGWPANVSNTSKLGDILSEPILNLELTRINENVGTSSSSNM